MEFQLYATCPDELTGLLAKEIASLGGTEVRTAYRVVYFSASQEVFYRVHLQSRLASRIYRILKEIPAHSPTIIFDKAKKIRFHELFSDRQAVSITVVAANDESPIPTHLIGSKLREAINDCFQHHLKVMPNQSSWDAVIGITGYFHHKRLMVSVDTSLESLHRRGFRVEGHPAPLKETLAAALLAVCEYDGTIPFFDPMCGSGTIVVEAAQMAINRAPLIHRKKGGFGFEHLLDFDSGLWQAVRDESAGGGAARAGGDIRFRYRSSICQDRPTNHQQCPAGNRGSVGDQRLLPNRETGGARTPDRQYPLRRPHDGKGSQRGISTGRRRSP